MALRYLKFSDIVPQLIPCLLAITLLVGSILLQLKDYEVHQQLNLGILRDNRHVKGLANSVNFIFGLVSHLQENLVVGEGVPHV